MMECWSCGRKLMREAPELGVGWFKCECGATYIKPLRVGGFTLTKARYPRGGRESYTSCKVPLRKKAKK